MSQSSNLENGIDLLPPHMPAGGGSSRRNATLSSLIRDIPAETPMAEPY
jgi:hypothetical protein